MEGNEQKPGNHGFHTSRLHFYEVTFHVKPKDPISFCQKVVWIMRNGLKVNSNKGNLIKLEIWYRMEI